MGVGGAPQRVTCEEGRKSRKAGRRAASWEFSARRGRRELGLPGEPGTRQRLGPGSETVGAAPRVQRRERQRTDRAGDGDAQGRDRAEAEGGRGETDWEGDPGEDRDHSRGRQRERGRQERPLERQRPERGRDPRASGAGKVAAEPARGGSGPAASAAGQGAELRAGDSAE